MATIFGDIGAHLLTLPHFGQYSPYDWQSHYFVLILVPFSFGSSLISA